MSIKVVGLKDLSQRLSKLSKFMTKTEKRRLTFYAAKPIVSAGRKISPVRSHPDKWGHPYENPRYSAGQVVARYVPGNLKKSFRRIPQKFLKRTAASFVGPFKGRQPLQVHGRTVPKSDGYYAPMAFGKNSTADDYMKKVIDPAVRLGGSAALKSMEKGAINIFSKAKTKLNFR
jgi:hypothetical protein